MKRSGVTIGIVIGIAMVILSFLFRDDLGALRNLVLIWGTPLAILLALWRSMVAERQVKVAQQQADILLENQRIAVSRDQPKLLLRHYGHSIGRSTEAGSTNKHFDGFTVANAGAVAVTITGVGASFGIPVDDPNAKSMPSLQLAPREWNGVNIRGDDLPVKLEPGDSARFMFDSNDLERVNRPYQWRCQDSLGTVYKVEGWLMRSQDTLTYMDLGAEFIEPDPRHQTWTISRTE